MKLKPVRFLRKGVNAFYIKKKINLQVKDLGVKI